MKNIIPIVKVLFSLILGGMLVFAGIRKFDKLTPRPTEIIDTIKKEEELPPNTEMLKIKNYFFGMKQTNYFWEFLGFCRNPRWSFIAKSIFLFISSNIGVTSDD